MTLSRERSEEMRIENEAKLQLLYAFRAWVEGQIRLFESLRGEGK